VRGIVLVICTLAFGATLGGSVSAGKAANGVSWFVNGKPAPTVINAVVGRGLGNAVKTYLDIKAKRKGPANEPLNGIACAYKGGGLKGARRRSTTAARCQGSTSAIGSPRSRPSPRGRTTVAWYPGARRRRGHTASACGPIGRISKGIRAATRWDTTSIRSPSSSRRPRDRKSRPPRATFRTRSGSGSFFVHA
jgi:hypothetical protein